MKTILLALVLTVGFITQAQAESPVAQGVYGLSGSVSYSRTTTDRDNLTSYCFQPGFRYFVRPGLALGASIAYAKSEHEHIEWETRGIGPLIRYYFDDSGVRPFVEAQYHMTSVDFRSKTAGVSGADYDATSIALSLGANFFLARNVALEPSLAYVLGTSIIAMNRFLPRI